MSCKAASRIRGRLAIRVWQIWVTICTMVGTSWGNADAIPEARVATTCIAACKSWGASSVRLVMSWRTMDRAAAASWAARSQCP